MSGGMNIDVRLIDGRTRTLDVSPNDMIDAIRSTIALEQGLGAEQIKLLTQNHNVLENGHTLNDYGIVDGSVIDTRFNYAGRACYDCSGSQYNIPQVDDYMCCPRNIEDWGLVHRESERARLARMSEVEILKEQVEIQRKQVERLREENERVMEENERLRAEIDTLKMQREQDIDESMYE
jgi:hypothetical protein